MTILPTLGNKVKYNSLLVGSRNFDVSSFALPLGPALYDLSNLIPSGAPNYARFESPLAKPPQCLVGTLIAGEITITYNVSGAGLSLIDTDVVLTETDSMTQRYNEVGLLFVGGFDDSDSSTSGGFDRSLRIEFDGIDVSQIQYDRETGEWLCPFLLAVRASLRDTTTGVTDISEAGIGFFPSDNPESGLTCSIMGDTLKMVEGDRYDFALNGTVSIEFKTRAAFV